MKKALVCVIFLGFSAITSADSGSYSIEDAYNDGLAHGSTKPLTDLGNKKAINSWEIEKGRSAYHECVLDNIKNASTRTGVNAVKSACRSKHWNKEWDIKLLY